MPLLITHQILLYTPALSPSPHFIDEKTVAQNGELAYLCKERRSTAFGFAWSWSGLLCITHETISEGGRLCFLSF